MKKRKTKKVASKPKANQKNLKTESALRTKDEMIRSFESRIANIKLIDRKSFKESKKIQKEKNKLIVSRNKLESNYFLDKFKQKQSEILKKYKLKKLNRSAFYEYIQYIENEKIESLMPFKNSQISLINKAYRKKGHLEIKLAYLKLKENKVLSTNINWIEKRIEKYSDFIENMKSTFASEYHARLIKKLETNFKKEKLKENKFPKDSVVYLKNTTKYYNNETIAVKALKNVNLDIKSGEFVVILGPSGSGKTTLLNIISGMDNATYGETYVAGKNLINHNSNQLTNFRRENIGYVFQQYGLLPNLNVRENVEIGANLQKDASKKIDIDELLKTIQIYEHRNKFPHELSGGQQQRVSIARSVAKNPEIIFGDEPTGAIDEEMSRQIMQLFLDVNAKFKTTIIIITHNPIFAELASKVVKVNNGEITKIIQNKKRKTVDQLKWN